MLKLIDCIYHSQVDIDSVQAKLKQLEVAVASHRKSMKEIEELAFGNEAESQQQFDLNNEILNEHLRPVRPQRKFLESDDSLANTGLRTKVCSVSYGIEEAAKSKLNVSSESTGSSFSKINQ